MNAVLHQLKEIIKLNPWQEKVLLAPNLTDGHQLTGKILLIPQQIECDRASFIFLSSLKRQEAVVLAQETVPGLIKPFDYYFEADRPANRHRSGASVFDHFLT